MDQSDSQLVVRGTSTRASHAVAHMFSDETAVLLSKSPCCLELLSDDIVIAGTYELDEETGDTRTGSLCLVKDKQVLLEYECMDGGVFDLILVPEKAAGVSDHVLVAHANGVIALYSVTSRTPEVRIIARYETGCKLLTSLHVISSNEPTTHWVGAGSSDGGLHVTRLHSMSTFERVTRIQQNSDSQPVWCLRLIKAGDHLLAVTGSDDCRWTIVLIDSKGSEQVNKLYENKDAESGVTSILLNIIFDHESKKLSGCVWIGSYDEKIRSYSLSLDPDLTVTVTASRVLRIPGSGVWRMRSVQLNEERVLIAGMYSGIHILDPDMKLLFSKDWTAIRQRPESEPKQLIYDVISLKNGSIVAASFYENLLHVLS